MADEMKFAFIKTKKTLSERFKEAFSGAIDDELYDELTEALILSDIPYSTVEKLLSGAKKKLKKNEMDDIEEVKQAVRESALDIISESQPFDGFDFPSIILVMGVNGVGKTTTIAKIANLYLSNNKSVMLAAADTFRAAASEQLNIWAQKLNVPIVTSNKGQDAASVIFDALNSAKTKKTDLLICDTAGRLHNNKNLMEELKKIYRVCDTNKAEYSLYTIVVLDAMTGQNSLNQLKEFSEVRRPDAVVLTKTDGSAKGGIVIAIADTIKVPVCFVGTGEEIDDIVQFSAEDYVSSIL